MLTIPSTSNLITKVRLVDHGGDILKRWYVLYYIPNSKRTKLVRKRLFQGLNDSFDSDYRYAVAAKIIQQVKRWIQQGYTAAEKEEKVIEEGELNVKKVTLTEGLSWAHKKKLSVRKLSKKQNNTYRLHRQVLEKWCIENKKETMPLTRFTQSEAIRFLDWLRESKEVGNKTYNNYLINLSALMAMVEKRYPIYKNPFKEIPQLTLSKSKLYKAFSQPQVDLIRTYLKRSEQYQLLLFINFIYYCFIRPSELVLIKRKNLFKGVLQVPGRENTKVLKTQYRQIPKVLMDQIIASGVLASPGEAYIFQNRQAHGEKAVSEKYFYKPFKAAMKNLGISEHEGYTLYSFKHTGNIRLYELFGNIRFNMLQNGHVNMETTLIYLRDLGLNVHKEIETFN